MCLRKVAILSLSACINKDVAEEISVFYSDLSRVPPTGIEPVHPPPEGGALSPELRGL